MGRISPAQRDIQPFTGISCEGSNFAFEIFRETLYYLFLLQLGSEGKASSMLL